MAVFNFTNSAGIEFRHKPSVWRNMHGKGWQIVAYSTDPRWYGGHYVKPVGFANTVAETGDVISFRTRKEARAALAANIDLFN